MEKVEATLVLALARVRLKHTLIRSGSKTGRYSAQAISDLSRRAYHTPVVVAQGSRDQDNHTRDRHPDSAACGSLSPDEVPDQGTSRVLARSQSHPKQQQSVKENGHAWHMAPNRFVCRGFAIFISSITFLSGHH